MRTNVAETSLRAHRSLTAGQLSRSQRLIVDAMRPGQHYTRRELEGLTGLRTGSVCGRVKELLGTHLEVDGRKTCSESGEEVEALRLIPAQRALFQ